MIRRARERAAGARPFIVSVDLPSGLNADLAEITGPTVQADLTVTFTAAKPANVLPPATHLNGRLVIANIGSPASLKEGAHSQLFLTEREDVTEWLKQTRYTPDSYKNTHGHALVVAGSRGYTGAAALCGNAAIRSGAGLVTICTPASAQPAVASQSMPEVMTLTLAETDRGAVSDAAIDHFLATAKNATVVAIGPGLSHEDERTKLFVRKIVEGRSTPVVIDADGLNCLAPWPKELHGSKEAPIVLTPHPGEMARLLGLNKLTSADRMTLVREFAQVQKLMVVLKGSRSIIATPEGRMFVNPTGNPGIGTAGSGDTLTGVIAGFLAQAFAMLGSQANALDATIAAVYVTGLAGDLAANKLGMRGMVASDIRDHLSAAIMTLDPAGETPST
jgi:NAD(P)H-hydrate epimerase